MVQLKCRENNENNLQNRSKKTPENFERAERRFEVDRIIVVIKHTYLEPEIKPRWKEWSGQQQGNDPYFESLFQGLTVEEIVLKIVNFTIGDLKSQFRYFIEKL